MTCRTGGMTYITGGMTCRTGGTTGAVQLLTDI